MIAFDLSTWKLSVPTPGGPTQVEQPALAIFTDAYFEPQASQLFTAPVEGSTQDGSKYPRSELRECNADGSLASWATNVGTAKLHIRQRVLHLPANKPELVAGQIHDAASYVLLIWVSGSTVLARHITLGDIVLDTHYVLGTLMHVDIQATAGAIHVGYNDGAGHAAFPDVRAGCYFKAGCYTQSNLDYDAPGAYGEVEITELSTTHT